MQLNQLVCLAFLFFSLIFTTEVSANDLRPWGENNDYVQLDVAGSTNQQPVIFNADQLNKLLGQFYKRVGDKEPSPYFSQDEISRIIKRMVTIFAKSKPNEDIEFGTSFNDSGSFLIPRKLNAGRLFVENGQLNLIIGMCAEEQDISYQQFWGKYRELEHGSRLKPVDKLGCELLEGNNTQRVNNRTDWIRLNINASLTSNAVPMFLTNSKSLTFGTGVLPVASGISAPAPSVTTQAKVQATPASESEERLITLKNLHEKGLITDTEYEQKRAAVLKGL
jgi:hypothetical protein